MRKAKLGLTVAMVLIALLCILRISSEKKQKVAKENATAISEASFE